MKLRMYPITVELNQDDVVISQERQGGAAASVTISVEQIDSLCEMLYRIRKSGWQKDATFDEKKTAIDEEPFVKEGAKLKEQE
jgi:hypothetical protein